MVNFLFLSVFFFIANVLMFSLSAALSVSGKPPDFSLKWVDDTHALAIYGSPYAGKTSFGTFFIVFG